MFLDFFYLLRAHGLPVGTHEWLGFQQALTLGLDGASLDGFYQLGRSLLVKSEGHYDAYDVAFARYFQDFNIPPELKDALQKWLESPRGEQGTLPPTVYAPEELLEQFKKLLEEQKERHDGGNRWIGTRGTSPFGNQGRNPQGMRVGEVGGGRSAIMMAEAREFQNYRTDITLDVRQFKVALKGLRRLENEGEPELKLERTIERTAQNAGDISLIFGPARKNNIKLLLLMDAGGSMEPYANLVSRLFTAASEARHWKRFEHYYFHNCVYARIYSDIAQRQSMQTEEMLRKLPNDFRVVFVGDACMAPWELESGGGLYLGSDKVVLSGLEWVQRIKKHCRDAVWLNPEPRRFWGHQTISRIGSVVPMFELSLDGLSKAMRRLRIGRRDLR